MRRSLFPAYCLLILFLIYPNVHAATPDNRSSKAEIRPIAEELALMLLGYGQFNEVAEAMTESAMQAFRPEAEKEVGRELTRSEDAQFRVIFRKVYAEVYPKEFWVEVIANVYSDFFSKEELLALISFYQTRTGEKLLYLLPSLAKELNTASLKLGEERQETLLKRLEEEISRLSTGKSFPDNPSSQPDIEQELTDIDSAMEKCKRIQGDQEIPIGCEISLVGETKNPALMLTLQNPEDAELYWARLSQNIGLPFCEAANASSLEGVVIMYIINNEQARIFNCLTDSWTDWFDYKIPKSL